MSATHTATFLFTDLVGSTALSSALTPEQADALRQEHFKLLRAGLDSTGGLEVKNLGDGLMAVYTSASRGLAGAVAMQQAVERRNRRTTSLPATTLAVRIGISMGEVTEEDGDYFGDAVIEASRLCAAARGGQILTTESLKIVVGRHAKHALRPLGQLDLKGLPEPVAVVEVVWEPATNDIIPLPSRLVATGVEAAFGFAGRADALEVIAQRLKEVTAANRVHMVLVGGEPGIGKTALVAHVARSAHDAGATVTLGAAREGLGVAFHPWMAAIGHLIEHAHLDLAATLRPAHRSALRRALPHLADLIPEAEAPNVDADAERYLLLEAVACLLAASGGEDGLVLVLDDLQWADAASLQMITHLIRSDIEAKVLVLGTFRPGDLGRHDPLTGFLADMRREDRSHRIDLAGLGDADVVGLIETAAGQTLEGKALELAHTLRRETGGNPFFVVEMLRHLGEADQIVQEDDGTYSLRGDLAELALPSSVREVVGRRVARLGDGPARLLSLAAVIGVEFDLTVLAAVADTDEDQALDILDAAARAALVRELDDPPGRYRFAHALVQSTLYSELSSARRQRAHARVADVLAASLLNDAAPLAHHLLSALQPAEIDRAVAAAACAGDQALAALAPDDAVTWYDRALDALERGGGGRDRRRAELLVARAKAEVFAGGPFRNTLSHAAGLMIEPEDNDLLVKAAEVRIPGGLSSVQETDPGQVVLIERALNAVGPQDSPIRARLLAALADEYGLGEDGQRTGDEAWDVAERLGDPDTLLHVFPLISGVSMTVGPGFATAAKRAEKVRMLLHDRQDPGVRLMCWNHIVWSRAQVLDWPGLEEAYAEMERLADSVGADIYRWDMLSMRAWSLITRGQLDEGERVANLALATGTRVGSGTAMASYGAHMLMLLLFRGQLGVMVEARSGLGDSPVPGIAEAWKTTSVWIACQVGRLDLAATLFAEVPTDPHAIRQDQLWLETIPFLGDVATYLDRPRLAADCYELLLPYRHSFWFSGAHDIGYMAYYLGRMARYLGRTNDAEEHLRFSVAKHAEKGLPYWEARSALELASLIRSSAPLEFEDLVTRARALADRYGLGGLPFPT